MARRLESKWSASVVVAPDGEAAVHGLDARAFDLVIADIGLPGLSGIEVLAAVRERQPRACRAAVTGSLSRECVEGVGRVGAST
jgi:DNA-binding NarL/FixJ family response regulator